jgi:hypothetical protein
MSSLIFTAGDFLEQQIASLGADVNSFAKHFNIRHQQPLKHGEIGFGKRELRLSGQLRLAYPTAAN